MYKLRLALFILLLLFISAFEIAVRAYELKVQRETNIPLQVFSIMSVQSWKDTEYIPDVDPHYRFRSISYDGGYEGMPYIEVEKTGMKTDGTLYWKVRIDVTSHPATYNESLKLTGEGGISCCGPGNIRWDGLVLNYDISVGEIKFECSLPSLHKNEFDIECRSDQCIDNDTENEVNYQLSIDPVTAKTILAALPDCDKKYELMHRANEEIAGRCRGDFYYEGSVLPDGVFDFQTPNIFEKHVMKNPDQFEPAGKGKDKITANDYWLKKMDKPAAEDNPPDLPAPFVTGDTEYKKIKDYYDEVRESDEHLLYGKRVIQIFSERIEKYPENENVPEALTLIERMNDYQKEKFNKEIQKSIDETKIDLQKELGLNKKQDPEE